MRTLGVALGLALLGLDAGYAHSPQSIAPCGLASVTPGVELVYPPIAKAAHVQGTVILMTRFNTDGNVDATRTLSGPAMLEKAATDFVIHLRADVFTGPRECAVALTFRMVGPEHQCTDHEPNLPVKITVVDPQHMQIEARMGCYFVEY
jgi:hypothetical protein